jgi:glycogen debranching enzyme
MPFKVQVGPHQVAIHHGQTVLVSEADGQINWPSEKGLYFYDTRVISSWTIYANGEPWILLNGGAITHYASRIYLTNPSIPTSDGVIPSRTLGLVISRMVNGGVHEDLDLTNNGKQRIRFQLEIALRCDFADIFESSRTTSYAAVGLRPTGRTPNSSCARVTVTAILSAGSQ